MRKISLFFLFGLCALFLPSLVSAQQYDNLIPLPADEAQQEEIALIEEEGMVLGTTAEMVADQMDPVDRGPHFFFGEDVLVSENLYGDVYVAGGTVEFDGMIEGDLLVAGGTVILNGDVTQDVRAAGGTIFVNGVIGQNLSIAAGSIIFDPEAMIGNSLVAAGGEVSLDGETIGRVLLGGGAAKLAGTYGSDVQVEAETMRVMPGVAIAGSLMANVTTETDIPQDVQIAGERSVMVTPPEERQRKDNDKVDSVGGVIVKAAFAEFVIKLVMGIISGGFILYFVPKLSKNLAQSAIDSTMSNAGWGFVYLFITPIVILLAMVSIVGMPLAGIIGLFYLLSMIGAKWVSAYAIGMKLVENLKLKNFESKYLVFALGLFVLSAIKFIPVVGWLIGVAAFFVGLGAIFTMVKVEVLSRKKAK